MTFDANQIAHISGLIYSQNRTNAISEIGFQKAFIYFNDISFALQKSSNTRKKKNVLAT